MANSEMNLRLQGLRLHVVRLKIFAVCIAKLASVTIRINCYDCKICLPQMMISLTECSGIGLQD